LQPFGWCAGCVMEGLHDAIDARNGRMFHEALDDHIRLYTDPEGGLDYVDTQSARRHGSFYGIEALLPVASIVRAAPGHRVVEGAVRYMNGLLEKNGAVIDHGVYSTEGNYVVAYPLAMIGHCRDQRELVELAAQELRRRIALLHTPEAVYQARFSNGHRRLPNWARGVAWSMLGLGRTLPLLRLHRVAADDLFEEWQRLTRIVLQYRRANGLWGCFMDVAESPVDTSGSAGIAAALARGVNDGILPESYRALGSTSVASLVQYSTPDGFLRGVAQLNKGGEALQRSSYRVISQFALGLFGQLYAATHLKDSYAPALRATH
jgi:unsaturated rhamnogalacturonyl hydrolase